MAQVDSENITATPTDPTRRHFLSRAAGAAAGGAALSLAIPPAVAGAFDPIFVLIEAHKTAENDFRAAVHHECALEQTIDEAKCKGNAYGGEVTIVETDDPRWTEAFVRTNDASRNVEAAALRMLEESPASLAGVVALLDYAVEYVQAGNCWPQDLEDKEKACRIFLNQTPWQHYVIANAAEFLRGLSAPTPTGAAAQRQQIAA